MLQKIKEKDRFGALEVLCYAGLIESGRRRASYWYVLCDCGNIKRMGQSYLRHAKSCGCAIKIKAIFSLVNSGCITPNFNRRNKEDKRIYQTRDNMLKRCYNPKDPHYKWYGARGIKVCKDWKDSTAHFCKWAKQSGYADNLTLERINNDGNYEPGNCRWITQKEQLSNTSRNIKITFNGETKTLTQWAEAINVPVATVYRRYKAKLPLEEILSPHISRKGDKRKHGKDLYWLSFDGEIKTIAEWSELKNLSVDVIRWRIKHGWSIEKTLTTPKGKHNLKEG